MESIISVPKNVRQKVGPSLVPRPPHSFCRLQYEKRGEPGNEARLGLHPFLALDDRGTLRPRSAQVTRTNHWLVAHQTESSE